MGGYAELRARGAEFVAEWAQWGAVLVLGATREAADEIAFEACGAALIGVTRKGLRDLVLELSGAELNRRALTPVGRVVREALAARVAAEAARRGELQYLMPVAGFPGFPRALAETFEELRLNGIGPDEVRECGQSGPDLALLLAAYENELSERGFADHAARVAMASEAVALHFRETAVLTLDVVPRTSRERDLVAAIVGASRAHLELRTETGELAPNTQLTSLQRYLFSTDAVPPREHDGSIEIFSTSGEALECVEIARRIGASGIPFDEAAILLRSPERYQPLVIEALRRAGIPAHCTRGSRRPDAAGRSFLALLHCAEERLSASRFAEYLSLGQMPDEEEPVTPALWERLLVDAAVIGGVDRWEARLAGLREEFQRRYDREEDEEERERMRWRIDSVDSLRKFALPMIERLATLPGHAMWGEWIEALGALAGFTLREPERIAELLEELEPMAEIGPVGLGEVLLVLGPRLNSLSAAPEEARYGKVWVGGIEEARGLAFRAVYVPGVNEGLFPRPPAEDPLLLHAQRDALGIALRAEDTELLRIAASCATERFALSYSRLDLLTGRLRVPSFYAFEAHRAAGGSEIDVRDFEAQARSATGTRIGWPAPENPADAIDDAEFDLSTLGPLTPGSGQYLKELKGYAVASLRARWMRWHKAWKPADGLMVEEIGDEALKPYTLGARAWSPSTLQQYARCPYRFALRGIFGLRPTERPTGIQRMDPATRGELFHQAQFELLREVAGREFTLDETLAALDGVIERVAAKAEAELAPAIPQIWRSEIQGIRADLRGWLQQRALREAEWTPAFYELSFGLKDPAGRDPRSRKEPVELEGGYRLQGSIDLVERRAPGILRVVDHKTGRIPKPKPDVVGGGEALQPLLYALAAEAMLNEPALCGRLSYATIAQNYAVIDVPVNDWTRRRAQQVLETIDHAILDGALPAAPRKDGCKGCDYLPVCGPYEEERVKEKSQVELKKLKELRGWK
ncbi:MAG: ATP-dependent nuclease subunit B-like protein [Candidatus Solibacter sp.]|nr:ATP-dependent nuclease subunit B-like protein [Candidatus Solibacter sp.]